MPLEMNIQIPEDLAPLTYGSWNKWSLKVRFSFLAAGFAGYLTGEVERPDTPTELAEWIEYNSRIIGYLGLHIHTSLSRYLSNTMTAAEAWNMLKERTHGGIVMKMKALRFLSRARLTPENTDHTLEEVQDAVQTVFGEPPTRGELFVMIMLNALDTPEYEELRRDLIFKISLTKMEVTDMEKMVTDAIETKFSEQTEVLRNETTNLKKSKRKPKIQR